MDKKIAEILGCDNKLKCSECFVETNHCKILTDVRAILALIESREKPMREALQTAKVEIEFMLKHIEEQQENIRKLHTNRMPIVSKYLTQIDSILKEAQHD